MKQATLKVAGTAALGVAIATVGAGAASAAAGPLPALPDTGSVTGALGQAPAVSGPVKQTTGLLDQKSGTQAAPAPAAQAPAAAQNGTAPEAVAPAAAPNSATRGLPVGAVQSAAKQVPLSGALGSAVPLGASVPGLGG
ncbi:ATP-binding protein [Kitasatospora kifunensis]|uniref:Pyruvate/2-oxoglutarate dehydrogenase complex dihydrolipoamide acyltransferase (E2) component n=1 Tax=Kitasatospora kifunensis TaxID=58351 RepID=A0A7W7VWU7_KITKI|nr:ATP-binding protein [Kitasatospora kifunensis]MBB4925333.1 pyruvate/2-oxoglutarate dehydrogenase complex dihydrolipoamide acyltransferase (E2) component [Kitasatospora kifunensis]